MQAQSGWGARPALPGVGCDQVQVKARCRACQAPDPSLQWQLDSSTLSQGAMSHWSNTADIYPENSMKENVWADSLDRRTWFCR